MSAAAAAPPVVPRKRPSVRGGLGSRQPPQLILPTYSTSGTENGDHRDSDLTAQMDGEREVAILNHCFDDIERFMGRLQQAAEAQSIINQRGKKKKSKPKSRKADQDDDLLTMKACPPSEEEFVDLFQKFKYSFSLLDRLKQLISPNARDLLHYVFLPLRLMVKTTGGPALGASVLSPAMTSGAVSLLQENLTEEEKEIWTSLGSNWTSPSSRLNTSVPPYWPVFLDGWRPEAQDSTGQTLEDPIQMQHKQDAFRERMEARNLQNQHRQSTEAPTGISDELDGTELPPEGERLYCCSYDFVARNSSELSVLQGETLEVLESSKRWWKCRNRFNEIGFVPFNILEPLSALNQVTRDRAVVRNQSKAALAPRSKYFSYAPSGSDGIAPMGVNPGVRPQSMVLPSTALGEDGDRVLIVNDELLQRLADRRSSSRPHVSPRTSEVSAPLDYHSPPAEVTSWLQAKGFSPLTIQCLGVLSGAQLFSLNKAELCSVVPEEGARVYSQTTVQKALLQDVRRSSELETAMEKQKLKISEDVFY